jgi:membrane associated rhomboid family serine protease
MTDPDKIPVNEPMFNIPVPAFFAVAALLFIHVAQVLLLNGNSDDHLVWLASFIPSRFADAPLGSFYSLVSYSMLHGGWSHLINNCVWLVAFGSPVAAALGGTRFTLFWIVCSVAAALIHFAADPGSPIPMIGASGAVSGMMGAAARAGFRLRADANITLTRGSLPSIRRVLSSTSVLVFLLIYLVVNVGIGIGEAAMPGLSSIAWQAHIGGLAAGFLLFSLFLRRSPS